MSKANISINGNNSIVGFINPSQTTKEMSVVEYNEIMESIIDTLNNGYTIDGFTGKDNKIVLTIKEA